MIRSILIGIMSLFLLAPVYAAGSKGHLYYGVKGGLMKPDYSSSNSAVNVGAMIGSSFSRYFLWEADINLTLIDGEVATRDWDIKTLGGYAVFRTDGDINFKGKAGLVYWDSTSDDDVDLSMGVGLGFKMGRSGMLDVEFTKINDHVDYISVGYIFNY